MIGRSRDKAYPTILFCSKDTSSRQKAKRIIEESGILDAHPGIQLGVCNRPPDFDKPRPVAAVLEQDSTAESHNSLTFRAFSPKPMRWFSQPIIVQNQDAEQCSTSYSTAGGLIRLHGEFYYMTVAHVFSRGESLWEDEDEEESEFEVELDFDPDSSESQDRETSQQITSTGSLTSSQSRIDDASFERAITGSSSSPRSVNKSLSESVLQDDTEEDDSIYQNSSSGKPIAPSPSHRPETCNLIAPEFLPFGTSMMGSDYTLLKIASFPTMIQTRFLPDLKGNFVLWPKEVAQFFPADEPMFVVTGRDEVLRGRMSSNPSFRSCANSSTFQELWTVRLSGRLVQEDCGLWVFPARTGELCGQIVASRCPQPPHTWFPCIKYDIRQRSTAVACLLEPRTLQYNKISNDDSRQLVKAESGHISSARNRTSKAQRTTLVALATDSQEKPADIPIEATMISSAPTYPTPPLRTTHDDVGFRVPPDANYETYYMAAWMADQRSRGAHDNIMTHEAARALLEHWFDPHSLTTAPSGTSGTTVLLSRDELELLEPPPAPTSPPRDWTLFPTSFRFLPLHLVRPISTQYLQVHLEPVGKRSSTSEHSFEQRPELTFSDSAFHSSFSILERPLQRETVHNVTSSNNPHRSPPTDVVDSVNVSHASVIAPRGPIDLQPSTSLNGRGSENPAIQPPPRETIDETASGISYEVEATVCGRCPNATTATALG